MSEKVKILILDSDAGHRAHREIVSRLIAANLAEQVSFEFVSALPEEKPIEAPRLEKLVVPDISIIEKFDFHEKPEPKFYDKFLKKKRK